MSRLSTQQIIANGDYLKPDFDPSTLTIAHLLGIFQYHTIVYPSQYNKAKLVEIFNAQIKSNAKQLLKRRLDRQETAASEDGILDGMTGQPLAPSEPAPVRRSNRRLSREPSMDVPPRPEPPKRRRSSAQPQLGRVPNRKNIISQPTLSEASEDEEESSEHEPARKVGRRNKESDGAGPSGRRISQKFGPRTELSGWEDNNIFQSGNESSSPARPPKANSSRKSTARKSRMSASAPPDMNSSPTRATFDHSAILSPPQSRFEPDLPASVFKPRSRVVSVKNEVDDDYAEDASGFADVSGDISHEVIDEQVEDDEDTNEILGAEDGYFEDKHTSEVAQRIADGISGAVAPRNTHDSPRRVSFWQSILSALLFLSLSAIAGQYKLESAPIGFCETGKDVNSALVKFRSERQALQHCDIRNQDEDKAECSILEMVPLPHPDACTPCPSHATCTRTSVQCDEGYILKPHLLSLIPYASQLADGLPGLGPIAFPPKCVDDVMRKRNIGALGKGIDRVLAVERGRRLCAGVGNRKDLDGGEARKWGFEAEHLKDVLHKKSSAREGETYTAPDNFDRLFGEAVDQLTKYGRIISDFDSEGRMYLASDHEEMSWNCRATVAGRQAWIEWRKSFFGALGVIFLGLYGRAQIAVRQAEDRRVAELVQIALDFLRNQEMAHHTDPVTTAQAFLSSAQLRDAILLDEHSVAKRRRLWDRVERVVEGNANVRANLEEIAGDEVRVWQWVGSSGITSPGAKRVRSIQTPNHQGYDEMQEYGGQTRFVA